MDRLLAKTRFTMFPFLPSYWLSSAILQWAEGITSSALFFASVLLSHTLFFGSIAFTRFGNLFYNTASAVQSRGSGSFRLNILSGGKDPRSPGYMEKLLGCITWIKPDTRALAVKDLRMFWRDTTQWGQSVMFFGLLGAYIINLRNFTHQLTSPFWIHAVAFLNLGACAFNLASVTTRFVFPQFSLEGRRLWIVGLAPMGLGRVVMTKYWLASILSLWVTLGLVTLSCYLLKMPWDFDLIFRGGGHGDDVCLERPGHRLGSVISQLEGNQPEQDRQRIRWHALFRAQFRLYHRLAGLASGGRRRVSREHRLGHRLHVWLHHPLFLHRLAATEAGHAAFEKL